MNYPPAFLRCAWREQVCHREPDHVVRRTLQELRQAAGENALPDEALLAELADDPRAGAQAILRGLRRRIDQDAARLERSEVMLAFERAALEQGFKRVAGVDEAGRGPLAGPVVAAAVVLAGAVVGIDDSKRLTWEQRETFYEALQGGPHQIGVSVVSASVVDQRGIQQANYQAMAEAVSRLSPPADYLLIDGFRVPGLTAPQERIVKGDRRSQSIAAASIIAKVTRDRMMEEYDAAYPGYGFAIHKGYGTESHLKAIEALGPCPIHRMSFAPLSRAAETGELF